MKKVNLLKTLLLVLLATMFISCESEFDAQVEKRTQEYLQEGSDSVALIIFKYEKKFIEMPMEDVRSLEKGDVYLYGSLCKAGDRVYSYKITSDEKIKSKKNSIYRILTFENVTKKEEEWWKMFIASICGLVLLTVFRYFFHKICKKPIY